MAESKKQQVLEEIKKLREIYPKGDSVVIPALWKIQEIYGYLHEEGLQVLAEEIGTSVEHLIQVASFYHYFRLKPAGKYQIHICTNISCMLNGAYEIVETLKEKLGVEEGEVTPDGMFSWEETECIGLCDKAPAGFINMTRIVHLDKEKILDIIENPEKYAKEDNKLELI